MFRAPLLAIKKSMIMFFSFIFIAINGAEVTNKAQFSHEIAIAQRNTPLYAVLSNPSLRAEFTPFLTNVLRQVPTDAFWHLIDTSLREKRIYTDIELYKHLIKHIASIKPRFFILHQLKALEFQKNVLGKQAEQLLGAGGIIDGCVEIGHPGVYTQAIRRFAKIEGTVYCINDQERMADRAQSFSFDPRKKFAPYDTFVPINNYEPIKESDIPNNSVDLVVCFIGLHHIPIEKLDTFVESIRRILRPGGTFLLRDHDAHDSTMKALVSCAHSVFNAVVVGTLEEEMHEYRNFRELSFWIELLENHGFQISSDRLLQEGDPTLNTMIKCTKIAVTESENIAQISHKLKYKKDYVRDITQTMLTVPEWHDVDRSQAYGEFINHTPFYEYPYFENIQSYWDVYRKSWNLARTRRSLSYLLQSEYTAMNTIIGIMTTFEYAAKGIVSWPFKRMISGVETGTIKMLVKDTKDEITALDERIKVLEHYTGTNLKLIDVPRYKEFLTIIKKLADTNIEILEIAGQKDIQLKVRYKDVQSISFCQHIEGCTKAYDWKVPTVDYTYCALLVRVDRVKNVIKCLESSGAQLVYIHDF